MSEQPTGYLAIDGLVSSDELELIQREFEVMLRDYASSTLPFPEYVAEYAKLHSRIWHWHPLPEQKHDGVIGDALTVHYDENYVDPANLANEETYQGIRVSSPHGYMPYRAKEALSLLDWLQQEKPTLERFAKEQAQ